MTQVSAYRLTALVVDDEPDMRLLIRLLLEAAPSPDVIDVIGEASDGTEALRVYETLGKAEAPDVVVLDYRLSDTTGIEVARRILAKGAEQRIVLFSAHPTPEIIDEARRIGISRCISKDCVSDLAQIVLEVLAQDE